MSQVSYGTITITDTNDIERIYTVYAKSNTNTDVPTAAASDWKELISEAPGTGNYIWQRTVVEKSGTGDKTYSSPVCLTGEEGTEGKGISSIIIKYGTSANWNTQPANWYDSTPEYSSATPNYWTQTTINYTTGNPTIKTTQDKALTQAIYDAVVANSIAQHANEDAQGALGQASSALQRVQAKYGTSTTEATTATKVANCDGFQLFKGAEVFIEFTHKNDVANPTLNVNSTGAKSIRDSDGNVLDSKFYWKDGSLVHFVYDGSYWRILDIVTTEKYNSLISDINGVSRAVGEKASQTDLTNLTGRVSTNETKISQTATSITSLVSNQDTYTAPDGTTKTNTIKSAIKQNAENISLRVEKNGVIAAINASTESSGGSAVKISADKVNIEGAAIFTNGRLSTANLESTIDGRIPDISGLASKSAAVAEEQLIYIQATSGTNSVSAYPSSSTTTSSYWVTQTGESIPNGTPPDSATGQTPRWTTKRPSYQKNYPVIFVAKQKKMVSGTITCTTPIKDDTTTIIDGGHITTGTIDATKVNVTNLDANQIKSGKITADYIDATNLRVSSANIDGNISFGKLTDVPSYAMASDLATTNTNLSTTNTNLSNEITARKQGDANYGICDTSAGTLTKVVTCSNFKLTTGAMITVHFNKGNTYETGKLQLNVNSTGAKDIYVNNTVTSSTNQLLFVPDIDITFKYSGSVWLVMDGPKTWYGSCSTSADIGDKTANINGCVICKGTKVELAMYKDNTSSSPRLNISDLGYKAIYFGSGSTTRPTKANGNSWLAGSTATFTFDGYSWRTSGKTYIGANDIVTGYLSADRIEAGSLAIGKVSGLQTALDDASKVADNFLHFNPQTGLDIGYTGDANAHGKTNIQGDGMRIYDKDDAVNPVARFTVNGGQIGRDGESRLVLNSDGQTLINDDIVWFGVNKSGNPTVDDVPTQESFASNTAQNPSVTLKNTPNGRISVITQGQYMWLGSTYYTSRIEDTFTYGTTSSKSHSERINVTTSASVTWTVTYDGNKTITISDSSHSGTATHRIIIQTVTYTVGAGTAIDLGIMTFGSTREKPTGNGSVLFGRGLASEGNGQVVLGRYNKLDKNNTNALIIGNGSSSNYSNAFSVEWDGDLNAAGGLTLHNHSSTVGTIKDAFRNVNQTINSGTWFTVCALSLEAGVWLIVCDVAFTDITSPNGTYAIGVTTSSSGEPWGSYIMGPSITTSSARLVRYTQIVAPSSTQTYYLRARQSSGEQGVIQAGAAAGRNSMRAVRII